jgi:uncharacterized RDD family membrane protein YckC
MASADYSVLTPERVSLEYGIAGVGSRAGAAILDTVIQAIALTVLFVAGFAAVVALAATRALPPDPEVYGAFGIAFVALVTFMVTSGYFMIFEIVWNGQTPGKRMMGLRVIRESGYPLRPVDSVIRNLVRIVDWLPIVYGFGVLTMLFNKRSKRLGDFAAGTIVVREGARRALTEVTAITPPTGTPRAFALSSSDATLVRDFLVRRDSMHPGARADLARRLAAIIAQRYQLPTEDVQEPELFLERLT